jgi:aryl-alcohol dehydrogenase-like predicted oxidoreductase
MAFACKGNYFRTVGPGARTSPAPFTRLPRADMITLARTAHEHGVTLFDAAEAYGPV